jgi:hypothetical protein
LSLELAPCLQPGLVNFLKTKFYLDEFPEKYLDRPRSKQTYCRPSNGPLLPTYLPHQLAENPKRHPSLFDHKVPTLDILAFNPRSILRPLFFMLKPIT